MPESHDLPSIGETGEALERRINALSDRDAYYVLFRLAYTGGAQQQVSDALDALAEFKAGRS